MFTGESVATVLVPKLINSALLHTFHLQKTEHYTTLFSHPEMSTSQCLCCSSFHEKNSILLIQYCLLWLKRSTKLMRPRVYLSFQSVSALSWLSCWLISFLLQEIILWLPPRIPCLPQENTFKLHWKHSNVLVLLSSIS